MGKLKDLTGHRIGRLVILKRVADRRRGWPRWLCQCDCGNTAEVESNNLRGDNTSSCGCLASERAKAGINRKHNRSGTPLYELWCKMRERCSNPNNPNYGSYGGRGIYVCDRWQDFENFLADMGERPSPKHSIDRINNDGPYSPDNCRWVGSIREQRANCRDNRFVTYKGETLIVSEWARRVGIDVDTLLVRLNAGWSVEDAMTRPTWNQKSITYRGQTLTVMEWSRLTGINRRTISYRLSKGWPPSRVLAKP